MQGYPATYNLIVHRTHATFGSELEDKYDPQNDELNGFGFYEGECQGCDILTSLNDLGLCEEYAGKLERDLIRQRDWDYSALAFGCPESKRVEMKNLIQFYQSWMVKLPYLSIKV